MSDHNQQSDNDNEDNGAQNQPLEGVYTQARKDLGVPPLVVSPYNPPRLPTAAELVQLDSLLQPFDMDNPGWGRTGPPLTPHLNNQPSSAGNSSQPVQNPTAPPFPQPGASQNFPHQNSANFNYPQSNFGNNNFNPNSYSHNNYGGVNQMQSNFERQRQQEYIEQLEAHNYELQYTKDAQFEEMNRKLQELQFDLQHSKRFVFNPTQQPPGNSNTQANTQGVPPVVKDQTSNLQPNIPFNYSNAPGLQSPLAAPNLQPFHYNPHGRVTKKDISSFRGGMNESWEDFIRKFNILCDSAGVPEQNRLIQLAANLDDAALQEYYKRKNEIQSYDHFMSIMRERFMGPERRRLQATILADIAQKPGEDVTKFAQRVEEKSRMVYSYLTNDSERGHVIEAQCLTTYLRGLDKKLKPLVYASSPATFEAAQQQARIHEITLKTLGDEITHTYDMVDLDSANAMGAESRFDKLEASIATLVKSNQANAQSNNSNSSGTRNNSNSGNTGSNFNSNRSSDFRNNNRGNFYENQRTFGQNRYSNPRNYSNGGRQNYSYNPGFRQNRPPFVPNYPQQYYSNPGYRYFNPNKMNQSRYNGYPNYQNNSRGTWRPNFQNPNPNRNFVPRPQRNPNDNYLDRTQHRTQNFVNGVDAESDKQAGNNVPNEIDFSMFDVVCDGNEINACEIEYELTPVIYELRLPYKEPIKPIKSILTTTKSKVNSNPQSIFSIKTLLFLSCIVLSIFGPLSANASTSISTFPMICNLASSSFHFALPTTPACHIQTENEANSEILYAKIMLYKRNIIRYTSKATVCKKVKHVIRTYENFLGVKAKKEETLDVPVSPEECYSMQKWGKCHVNNKVEILYPSVHGIESTRVKMNFKYSGGTFWCCNWKVFEVTNCYLYEGLVYKRHNEVNMESTLGDVSKCDYSQGEKGCSLENGSFLLWKVNKIEQCKFIEWASKNGKLLDFTWISHDKQLALTFNHTSMLTNCDGNVITVSDQSIAFRFLSKFQPHNESLAHTIQNRNSRVKRSLEIGPVMSDTLALHLQAMEVRFQRILRDNFYAAYTQTCNTMSELAALTITNMLSNPTLAIRHVLHKSNIIAISEGQSIRVTSCFEFTDNQKFHFERMNNKSCTQFVPIKFEYQPSRFQKGFLDPVTNVIHPKSPPSECSLVRQIMLQVNGTHFMYNSDIGSPLESISKLNKLQIFNTNITKFDLPLDTVIHKSVVMYKMQVFTSHNSLNDIFSSLNKQALVLKSIGVSTDNLNSYSTVELAHKIASEIVHKGLLGWFYNISFAPYSFWLFLCACYVTIMAIMKCCPIFIRLFFVNIKRKVGVAIENRSANIPNPSLSSRVFFRLANSVFNTRTRVNEESHSSPTVSFELSEQSSEQNSNNMQTQFRQNHRSLPINYDTGDQIFSAIHEINALDSPLPRRLFLDVYSTDDTKITSLFDTGATLSLIHSKFVKKLRLNLNESIVKVTSITGHHMDIIGYVSIDLMIAGKYVSKCRIHVVKELKHEMVFGVDLMSLFESVTVKFLSPGIQFGKLRERISLAPVTASHANYKICLTKKLEIPSHHEKLHYFPLPKFPKDKSLVHFQPLQNDLFKMGVICNPSISPKCMGRIPVVFQNITDSKVIIPEKFCLGSVTDGYTEAQPVSSLQSETEQTPTINPFTPDRLKKLESQIDLSDSTLNQTQRARILDIIREYADVFAVSDDELGFCPLVTHKITVTDESSFKAYQQRLPPAKIAVINQHLDLMLKLGIIRPSKSHFSSPIVLASKKDGTTRFCVNYKKLNAVTKVDNYPLPKCDEILDKLGGSQYYSTIDLKSAFWQVGMDEESIKYTAFVTHRGLFEFTKMPFGLVNASATQQRLISEILKPDQSGCCFCFIDDTIIGGASFEKHNDKLIEVLRKLRDAGMKCKPSKCFFGRKSVPFLGYKVTPTGLSPDISKVDKVRNARTPTSVKELQELLGMLGYYRRFIDHYALIAAPLFELLKKNVKFDWTKERNDALEKLKSILTTAPVLAYPKDGQTYLLACDASDKGIGAVLSQYDESVKRDRPIAFFSRNLSPAQLNYSTMHKECLGLVASYDYFYHYLCGNKVYVYTDNSAVCQVMTATPPLNSRIARWQSALMGHDFQVFYRPGIYNKVADYLSRNPLEKPASYKDYQNVHTLNDDDDNFTHLKTLFDNPLIPDDKLVNRSALKASNISEYSHISVDCICLYDSKLCSPCTSLVIENCALHNELPEYESIGHSVCNVTSRVENLPKLSLEQQKLDVKFKAMIDFINIESLPEDKKLARITVLQRPNYDIIENLLHQISSNPKLEPRVAVPLDYRDILLKTFHDSPLGGAHAGRKSTYRKLSGLYFWDGMYSDILKYVRRCNICQLSLVHPKDVAKTPLQSLPVCATPFERVSLDIIGKLPMTERGNQYILVIVDSMTKWAEAFPMPDQSARTIADIFVREIICRHGAPKVCLSDKAPNLIGEVMSEVARIFEYKKINTTPYKPSTNAQVERTNGTIGRMLKKYANESQTNWDQYLPLVLFSYRISISEAVNYSPFYLLHGRYPRHPINVNLIPLPNLDYVDDPDYVTTLVSNLQLAWKLAGENNLKAQLKDKFYHDKSGDVREPQFKTGDKVLLRNFVVPRGGVKKLTKAFSGPYKIISVSDDNKTAEIIPMTGYGLRPRRISLSHLKVYEDSEH